MTELYQNTIGTISIDEKSSDLSIEIGHNATKYSWPCFWALRRQINLIDIKSKLLSSDRANDIEIITPCGVMKAYVFTIIELIEFKDLLNGTKVMLDLYSIIHQATKTEHLVSI